MRLLKLCAALAPVAFSLALSSTASAALLDGKTVTFQYYYPSLGAPYSNSDNGDKLVGAGIEVSNVADNVATMDISDTNLFIDFTADSIWSTGAFNGFKLTDTFSAIGDFTSVTINAATNLAGFSAANITFDGDNIFVNWQGLDFDANTVVSLDVNGGGNTPVPEPLTFSLFGVGLAGAAMLRRRRKA